MNLLKINELSDLQCNIVVGVFCSVLGLCIEWVIKVLKCIAILLIALCRGKNHRIIKYTILDRTSARGKNKRKDIAKKYVYDMFLVFTFLVF